MRKDGRESEHCDVPVTMVAQGFFIVAMAMPFSITSSSSPLSHTLSTATHHVTTCLMVVVIHPYMYMYVRAVHHLMKGSDTSSQRQKAIVASITHQ